MKRERKPQARGKASDKGLLVLWFQFSRPLRLSRGVSPGLLVTSLLQTFIQSLQEPSR